MKPILSGGSVRSRIAFIHSIAFWSAHNGVPSGLTRQVKPLLPACSSLGFPSCIIMIEALFRFCRKVRFLGKIQKSGIENSTTYRLPNPRKSNFATEPFIVLMP
jgi:hypothetical protein